ncbi:uncharacterized protein LOC107605614 [Arachis ipaensis]|uniref:uncharacterized protein LOC107605614 n=1 Tax=Arachis ipaensis TaxID=130454 RepID=UPI0007AF1D21|nr:uncharacterized protein LOC107605614 [Arachis ipaensis]
MAPRGCGRGRGRGRTSAQGPGINPNDPATVAALGQQMNNNDNGDNEAQGPMTLATLLKVNPPKFKGTTDLTKADTWFQAMEQALQAQLVPEEQCVEFATYLLTGEASHWTAKELELLQLKESVISVSEYTDKFMELFKFSRMCQGALGDFEEWKCVKYEGRLRSDIFSSVGPMEI